MSLASAEQSARPARQTVPSLGPVSEAGVGASRRRVRSHWRSRNPYAQALQRTLRNPMGMFGGTVLLVLVMTALLANVVSPYDPIAQYPGRELQPPGVQHWLGTDHLGRDVLSRVIFGSRNSLLVGVLAVMIGAGAGIFSGLLAGFLGGWVDRVIMRWYDAQMAFPGILLGIAVVTVLGTGMFSVAYALAFGSMPVFARLTRSTVLTERNRDYVLAARCLGGRDIRIMFLHVLPNAIPPLIVALSLSMGFAVLAESSLSFLGLGTQPPDPSWGAMLSDSRAYLQKAAWLAIFPGIALALLLLSLNYLADALREALDPRRINA
jgi:peptide/nickel transport system permease protein